jgi:hypothetical protein
MWKSPWNTWAPEVVTSLRVSADSCSEMSLWGEVARSSLRRKALQTHTRFWFLSGSQLFWLSSYVVFPSLSRHIPKYRQRLYSSKSLHTALSLSLIFYHFIERYVISIPESLIYNTINPDSLKANFRIVSSNRPQPPPSKLLTFFTELYS